MWLRGQPAPVCQRMRKIPRVLKISQKAVNSVKPSVHCHDMGRHTESCRRLVGAGVTQRSCGAASLSHSFSDRICEHPTAPVILCHLFFSEITCFAGHRLQPELCLLLPLELICLPLTAPLFGCGLLTSEGCTEILEPPAESPCSGQIPKGNL